MCAFALGSLTSGFLWHGTSTGSTYKVSYQRRGQGVKCFERAFYISADSVTVDADLAAARRARNAFVYGNVAPEDDFDIEVEWDENIEWPEDDD